MLGYIGVIFAMAGMVENVRKKPWCYILWFTSNVLLIIHNYGHSDWAQLIFFSFCQIMCVIGTVKWTKEYINQRKINKLSIS